jgi:acyl-CoA hydrolase
LLFPSRRSIADRLACGLRKRVSPPLIAEIARVGPPLPDLTVTPSLPGLFRLVDVVFPGQANHHGTLFGGTTLAMMDKFAFVLASRHLRRTLVTAAVSETDFRAPVPVGHLTEVDGRRMPSGRRAPSLHAS